MSVAIRTFVEATIDDFNKQGPFWKELKEKSIVYAVESRSLGGVHAMSIKFYTKHPLGGLVEIGRILEAKRPTHISVLILEDNCGTDLENICTKYTEFGKLVVIVK